MTRCLALAFALMLASTVSSRADEPAKERVYEMRTYYANEGKLDALHARFRDHTCKLFEKHGIANVGYFVPVDNADNKLIYFVSYPSREAREASWKGFMADPDWKAAYAASTKEGRLVSKVENVFMTPADYSPAFEIAAKDPARLFELREYSTNEGKLPDIHKRFKDHTIQLFKKHGMENLVYFDLMDDQKRANDLLVYLIAHKDKEARDTSFDAFRKDPAWEKARTESEEAGPILVKGGVKATLLTPVDYSPMK